MATDLRRRRLGDVAGLGLDLARQVEQARPAPPARGRRRTGSRAPRAAVYRRACACFRRGSRRSRLDVAQAERSSAPKPRPAGRRWPRRPRRPRRRSGSGPRLGSPPRRPGSSCPRGAEGPGGRRTGGTRPAARRPPPRARDCTAPAGVPASTVNARSRRTGGNRGTSRTRATLGARCIRVLTSSSPTADTAGDVERGRHLRMDLAERRRPARRRARASNPARPGWNGEPGASAFDPEAPSKVHSIPSAAMRLLDHAFRVEEVERPAAARPAGIGRAGQRERHHRPLLGPVVHPAEDRARPRRWPPSGPGGRRFGEGLQQPRCQARAEPSFLRGRAGSSRRTASAVARQLRDPPPTTKGICLTSRRPARTSAPRTLPRNA